MNRAIATKTELLLRLADDKLAKLQGLQESLQWLHDHMEEGDAEDILAELNKQAEYRRQIVAVQEKYKSLVDSAFSHMDAQLFCLYAEIKNSQSLPEWYFPLYKKLKKQKALLMSITDLNKKTKDSAIRVRETIKNNIKEISQHRSIIQYYHQESNQIGSLFDFKEGKRRR